MYIATWANSKLTTSYTGQACRSQKHKHKLYLNVYSAAIANLLSI